MIYRYSYYFGINEINLRKFIKFEVIKVETRNNFNKRGDTKKPYE